MAQKKLPANETLMQVACRLSRTGGWSFSVFDQILQWSDEVCTIHELSPGTCVSLSEAFEFCQPDFRDTLRTAFTACVVSGTPYDLESRVVTVRGNAIWVRTIGQAVRDPSGCITHVQGAVQDITARKHAELADWRMADRLTTTLESITDAFFTLDFDWRFTYLNKQAERVLLRPRVALLGKELLAEFKEGAGSSFEREFRRAATERCSVSFEDFYAPLDIWVEVRIFPVDDGLAVYFSDVSERHQTQQALEESEARFKIMARATSDVIWDWNLKTDEVWRRSESVMQLCGVAPAQYDAARFWLDRIHADDRKRVVSGIQAALLKKGNSWSDEYRFMRHDGSHAFVMDRAVIIRDVKGAAVRVVGAVTDLSQRRQLELELDRLHKEKALLLESAGEGFFGIDNQGRCTFINGAATRMLGYSAAEVIGHPIHALVRHGKAEGEPYSPEHCKIWNTLKTGQPCRDDTEIFWRKDGSFFPVGCASYPILDDDKAVGVVVTFSDITERHDAKLEIVRINRSLQLLRRGSETLLKASSEQQLLTDICRAAVEVGGYQSAAISFPTAQGKHSPVVVAQAAKVGIDIDHQSLLDAWSAQYPSTDDPLARVMRCGSMEILDNPGGNAAHPPTHQPALVSAASKGLRLMICLPLRTRDQSLGLLCLFAPAAAVLSTGEAELLGEMADDLALGILHIRARQEQRRIEASVLKVAAGVSASTGVAFFEQLALNMAGALGAHAAFVARLLPGPPLCARTIAAVLDGKQIENFDYVVTGTPCENLVDTDNWVVPTKVSRKYPQSLSLAALGAESYVGRRLDSSCGRPLGVLFVLFREPLLKTDFISTTLRIFAARAAAELERREADLRIHEQASLLDKAKDAIIVRDTAGLVRYWNKGAERLYGWTADDALGQEIGRLLVTDTEKTREVAERVLEQGEWTAELVQHHKDGRALVIEAHWSLVRNVSGQPDAIFSIETDITQRKAIEHEVQQLAFYDVLTQLPNRRLLLDRLRHALASNTRRGSIGALLFLDLDNFKTINDTLGHDAGDYLLQQVAVRLSSCVRTSDTVARFGGDEFAVILENLSETPEDAAAAAKDVADKIIICLNQPTLRDNKACYSTPSIGIALFDAGQVDADELINRADFAMYQAKATGRNTLRFFDPAMQAKAAGRNVLIAELQQALRDDQFVLHYQLQADDVGKPIGVEAQLYWTHPQRGVVHADEFIGLAEECGLILPLSKWMLDRACQQLVAWSRQPSLAQLHLAVDLSARHFQQSDFVDDVLAAVDRAGANPAQLKLQLTQSMLLEDLEDALQKAIALKAKGIGIGLNDFGIEYASLSYLKRLPLEQLKINRAFVRDVLSDPDDAAIASALVALGKSLGLAVIAEGVDSAAQRDFLQSHGCKAYQGGLYAGPLPVAGLEALMEKHRDV